MDPSLHPDDVAYAGVVGSRALLRDRRVTAVELVALSLARIDRYDGRLNAFRTVFHEQALSDAAAADAASAAGSALPLLGVPIAVKDNVDVAGHAPAHGTASAEPAARADAEQVRRLRAAGAVVVGTTHLPELALWPFTESQTWGATRNPWSTDHTTGGSSGGSAAAVAAGLVPAATASDGGGSIRGPAAACGLVGLKPQRGRVPLGGTGAEAEHWHGLSVAGVLTRTTADTALLMSVLTSGALPGEVTEPGPLRIAWTVRAPVRTPVHPAVERALHHALALLRGLGHVVERRDPDYRGVQASFLARYARGAHDDLVRLADPSATEPRTRLVGAVGGRITDRALARAIGWGDRASSRLAVLPGDADVLVTPTLAAPPREIGSLDGLRAVALAGGVVPFLPTWNVTGQPAVSVPVGVTASGLPLAVQLVGRPHSEALLLGLASSLERVVGWVDRRPPLDEGDLAARRSAPGGTQHRPR